MSRPLKVALLTVGVAGGLLLIGAVLLPLLVDASFYKRRFEIAASDPSGLKVRVGGQLRLAITPDLLVRIGDLRVHSVRGDEILSAERAMVGIALLPLLRNEVRIKQIVLVRPRITIERGRDGVLNLQRRDQPRGAIPALDQARVSIMDGTLLYADSVSGESLKVSRLTMGASRLRLSDRARSALLGRASFQAKLACDEVRTRSLRLSALKASVTADDGVFDLKPAAMTVFGGRGSGSVRADFSRPVPRYQLRLTISQFRAEDCLKVLSPERIATGAMDLSANLQMEGTSTEGLKRTMRGTVSLRGRDIRLDGHDLDREFSRFEASQSMDLVDVGTFFLVGPLGVAVTKGYDFARLLHGSGGHTTIRHLVSDWSVDGGVTMAEDVAMATDKHRLALRGRLDFVNHRFDTVTVALVDEDGCATVRQELRGTFEKPELTKPSVLRSLLGPALRVVKRTKDLLPGGPCDVFYRGSVPAPDG